MNLVEVILLTAITTSLLSYMLRTLFGNKIIRHLWMAVLIALLVGASGYLTIGGPSDSYAVSTAITKSVVAFTLMRFFAKVITADNHEKKGVLTLTSHHH